MVGIAPIGAHPTNNVFINPAQLAYRESEAAHAAAINQQPVNQQMAMQAPQTVNPFVTGAPVVPPASFHGQLAQVYNAKPQETKTIGLGGTNDKTYVNEYGEVAERKLFTHA
ncbi:hypothetical protein tpqmel_0137 [Candidatus Gastranaerophilus sp. (ex Termes propinquus)]|nr:hypothetical protein tpqmel_0137 [Candidatus Gastranaerophilus sp. (ex Termes propinquus)]